MYWLAPETKGRPLQAIRGYWESGGHWPHEQTLRENHFETDFHTICIRLSRPAYRDRSLVERKVAQAVAKVSRYLTVEVTEGEQGLEIARGLCGSGVDWLTDTGSVPVYAPSQMPIWWM